MFSKISQLGKTFAEEINRINDEVNNTPTGQNQIADPRVAKRIIATNTPDVDELEKPENLQKEDTLVTDVIAADTTTNEDKSDSGIKQPTTIELASERVVPGTTIKYSSLPPEICSKLNKFIKYEKKYPQLYDAYKIEKKKTALINAFENMLKEKTPCSSIGELNAVRDYLDNLENKNGLLNEELMKLTKDKNDKDDQIKELQLNLSDLQKSLQRKDLELEKLKKDEEKTGSQLEEAKKSTDAVLMVNKQLKDENQKLRIEINDLRENSTTTVNEDALKKEIELLQTKLNALAVENSRLSETLHVEEGKQKEDQQIMDKTHTENLELKDKIRELEKSLESTKQLSDSFKKKLESLATLKVDAEEAIKPSSESNPKTKSKKKKGKKSVQPISNTKDCSYVRENKQSASMLSEAEMIELNHRLKETESKLDDEIVRSSSLEKQLKLKVNEIEELKEMLRGVGDSLVESEKSNKETKDLVKELEETKQNLDACKSELEMLRIQNSNSLKDYEHTKTSLSKKLGDSAKKIDELQTLIDQGRTEINRLNSCNQDQKAKVEDLEKLLSRMKEAEARFEKDINKLSAENEKLKSENANFKLTFKEETEVKAEIDNLKVQLTRKERTLDEAESKIKFLQEEKNKINDTLIELKVQNKEYMLHEKNYKETIEKLTSSNEKLKGQINENTLRINKLSLENTKLVKELDEITDQYNQVKHVKSTSNEQVESMKKRVDELVMRNKEYENRIDLIQEELIQSRNMLQERTREMATLRKLMLENDESKDAERIELKNKISKLTETNERLENDSLLNMKRKQKEIDELRRKLEDSSHELEILKEDKKALSSELTALESRVSPIKTTNDSEDSEYNGKIVDSLRESLNRTEVKLKEVEEMNHKLRSANKEASDKLIYLNKKYKLLSQQYRKNSISSSSRNNSAVGLSRNMSISSSNSESGETLLHPDIQNSEIQTEEEKEEVKEKSIYIKNVLLGYLEHKEQRQLLLPVVKALLFMSDDESKKMSELVV
ncbi:hypothetical protein CANINC_004403 [Pichia inconspicua]|uniref:GRIP domain-containing protein n=1 Tax=Pichia inconspicua TaxID=52247 RepID=A0A4T0WXD4_9ASCO|nr:hypothetical protein CANINC_004403 [[Candida] inconspicua]